MNIVSWYRKLLGISCNVVFIAIILFPDFGMATSLPGVWKTYTSKKEMRDVAAQNGVVWAATSGGLFSMTLRDSLFQEFTTSEGLRTNDLSAVTVDREGTVWLGAVNGFLHAYSPLTKQWKYITDIARKNVPRKKINGFLPIADTLYIASEMGLSEYLTSRDKFGFTAESFGGALQLSGNVTGVIVFRDSIWISTTSGIAAAPRSFPNLSAPSAWKVWQSGLPSNTVNALIVYRNNVYAATAQGLAQFSGGSWGGVPGATGINIEDVAVQNDTLYFIAANELRTLDSSGTVSLVSTFTVLSSLATEGTEIIVGSERNGLYLQRGGSWQAMFPKGPPTNRVIGLAVDNNSVLWAGTGAASGEGFMSFNGTEWTSYTFQDHPALGGNLYYRTNIGRDNVKWVSSWGYGVALVGTDGTVKNVFDSRNGLVPTRISPPNYVVVFGVVTDRDGNGWIGIRTGRDDTTFAVINRDLTFTYVVFPKDQFGFTSVPIFTDMVVDAFGTKWLANARGADLATPDLFFHNERGFPGTSPLRWGRIREADGLTSDKIYALAVDQSNQVWVGTDQGVNIIVTPYSLQPRLASYAPLREQRVNALAVDPINNKWVATTQGVFVLSPDGTAILAQYTVENTEGKLVDDNIQSIAIDTKTGTVYFGSDKGLSALTTAAVAPVRSFDELTITPNPYYLPSSSAATIDGLVQNSGIKILSVDGKVIKDLKTPGGRVGFWDGTDSEGRYVSSGIYIIVAFSENGNQVAAGKVAVLRK